MYRDRFPAFDSLYLGGGTPSALSARQLKVLLEALFRTVKILPGAEITVEVNPDDITPELLEALRVWGVNRVSVGVQSFYDEDLSYLQRRHTVRRSEQALELIRDAGFTNISIDLMYCLETQTEESWMSILDTACGYKPEHLSCYQLTIAKNTPFGRRCAQTRIPLDEERERSFFLLTAAFLEDQGYRHYEISNYARSDQFQCRHNQKYWCRTPYLGIGPAAHSFFANHRWWNVSSIKQYCTMLSQDTRPIEQEEQLTPEQEHLESLLLGFRTDQGVARCLVEHTDTVIPELERLGLVKITHDRIIPTTKGFLVADRFPLLFDGV